MPLAFEEFQEKGVLDFYPCSSDPLLPQHRPQNNKPKWENLDNIIINKGGGGGGGGSCSVGSEPTSVLDARRSPSPPISSSTLSSSLGGGSSGGGGGGGATTDTTGVATTAVSCANPSAETGGEKCGLGLEDWESVLSGSSSQEQSILKLIMGDVEDPYVCFNKLLQSGAGYQDIGFNAGFGVVDQGFGFEALMSSANLVTDIDPFASSDFPPNNGRIGSVSDPIPNPALLTASAANFLPGVFQGSEGMDEKPQIFNPPLIMNQNQVQFTQNPAMFLPFSFAQVQEHNMLSPPPPKRLNSGPIVPNFHQAPNVPFSDSGQELYLRRHQQQHQLQLLQQRPAAMAVAAAAATKNKLVSDELANQQLQQAIVNQLFQTAELIEAGNPLLAQGILARLNQQLSPIGKPFQRAAFYFKEALQFLLHVNGTNNSSLSSYNLIFKIGAYKTFSEISPILQFANFTCNQALLEASEGYDRIHIIDFDIGYGGQWASLMQELVLRNGGAPSLKITAFTSPSTHEDFELRFTQENLKQFASDINMDLELEILTLESLNSASWPLPLRASEKEAVAVNLPIGSFSNQPSCLPLVLRFVKQLSPKIVVSLDRGCDRTDVSFPHHMIHALQSYSSLLESLDAVNVNLDSLQKIERFLLHPGIERIVLGRHRSPDRTPPWRNLFLQSGFTPLTFSNFTESQAECLVQRTPVRGFHVEKRQSSLVLCWQRKELISVSAWRG